MPHPELVARVGAAWQAVREIHFGSEAERVAHEFIAMIEAAVGQPLPAPDRGDPEEADQTSTETEQDPAAEPTPASAPEPTTEPAPPEEPASEEETPAQPAA